MEARKHKRPTDPVRELGVTHVEGIDRKVEGTAHGDSGENQIPNGTVKQEVSSDRGKFKFC